MEKKGKVLVAMSGGIDSSVCALLLKEQGYDVIGITMKTWDYSTSGSTKKETGCCSLDSINDARMMAVEHNFPHYILDIREEFGNFIIDNFVDEYLAGRTPNPCVLCNTHIKWEALLKRADQLGCEYIATGHYAQIRNENGRFVISKGLDESKDQSYVLWGLKQECLKRTLLPLGNYKKSEIKKMAIDRGYHELAAKSESYEICFVPDNDYRSFLKHKVEGLEEKVNGGDFILKDGTVVGKHKGYPFYTIGQRKGLEIAFGEPYFVIEIIPETMLVRNYNLIKFDLNEEEKILLTKIRYKDSGTNATVKKEGEKLRVIFHKSVSGIAPGQSAVFYDDNDLVGGGFIERERI
jgi:tRNA-uridine 2-sulfurtransferase